MSGRNVETRTIEITEFAFNKIMSWAQALDEVMFLGLGANNIITDAVRLLNISNAPRNFCDYSKKEMADIKEKNKLLGLEVVCMGHSHPNKGHLKYPSRADYRYLPKKYLQAIAFPVTGNLCVWRFGRSYRATLNSKIYDFSETGKISF